MRMGKRVMFDVILHIGSMLKPRWEIIRQRDHQVKLYQVNGLVSIQEILTCLGFLFSYMIILKIL